MCIIYKKFKAYLFYLANKLSIFKSKTLNCLLLYVLVEKNLETMQVNLNVFKKNWNKFAI